MKLTNILTLCALSFWVHGAMAQPYTPGVDQRQINEDKRIREAVITGSVTEREANQLARGQKHVERMEDRYRADGVVTPRERARLHQAENVQSRHIYRQSHDAQHDYDHDGRVDRPRRAR